MKELIRKMFEDIHPYDAVVDNYDVILNANENPENLLLKLPREELLTLLDEDFNRYPENTHRLLREEYAKYAGVEKENVLVGNGGDQMLLAISDAFLDFEDCAVAGVPTFVMYQIDCELVKGKFVGVSSNPETFVSDVDGIIETANEVNAKLIYITSPNNPTGCIWKREDVINVIEKTKAVVVIDEAYFEFNDTSFIDLIHTYDRVIIIRTLSKAFALAGLRIGFAIADEKLINTLGSVKPFHTISSFSAHAGVLMLRHCDIMRESVKRILDERERMYKRFLEMKDLKVFPSGANFLFIKTKRAPELINHLESGNIGIRKFGGEFIRVSIGTRDENDRLLKAFEEVFEQGGTDGKKPQRNL